MKKRENNFLNFEKIVGYNFKNKNLLKEALTHRSFLNEHPQWPVFHNERLEYLGDAVLELVVSEFLFKNYLHYNEGQLTALRAALVNHEILAKVAHLLNLENFLFLSKGELKDKGKGKMAILANAIEALIGAIFLDGGYQKTVSFIKKNILIYLGEIIKKGLYQNPKSQLQEIIQERFKITPVYKVLSEKGPDHQKEFLVGVFKGDKLMAKGKGSSKQEAETKAALSALIKTKKK